MIVLRLAARVLSWLRPPGNRAASVARRAVRDVDQPDVRAMLSAVVTAAAALDADAGADVVTALLAYGAHLYRAGSYTLSADVFRATIDSAAHVATSTQLWTARYWLGYALRECGEDAAAAKSFRAAHDTAHGCGERELSLRARIGMATIDWAAGRQVSLEWPAERYQRAAAALDAVLAEATAADLPAIVAAAAHDRGAVAHLTGDYRLALARYATALPLYTDRDKQFRLLTDIGRAFVAVGLRDVGREAYHAAQLIAPEPWARWLACINLLDLASLERHEDAFEQWRRALARAALPAHLRAAYWLHVGEGYCFVFGRPDRGRIALRRAARVATRGGLPRELNQARALMAGARGPARAPKVTDIPPELAPLADAIHSRGSVSTLLRIAHDHSQWESMSAASGQLPRRRRKGWRAAGPAPVS